ncbi:hypothetical protein ACFWDQ_40440 [Streptomyces sp. NPDC060053]|uniref:hypothetical protein n=1 Tax=Streptomyces sp. NPDC060053 TaxID=3347047 RepID=UPI0036B25464
MTPPDDGLRAGAGRAAIDLTAGVLPVDGFTSVHDPLHARVAVLDDGRTRLALVVIDQTSIFDDQVERTRKILRRTASVEASHALVVASHTFSAPHVLPLGRTPPAAGADRNARLATAVDDAVTQAAEQAIRTLRPARLGFGRGICRVGVQRDVPTPHGWWLGADDAGLTDDSVGVLRIDSLDGRPIALLVNHAVQSSVMNGATTATGERQVSADLAGAAARRIETHHGDDTVALFLIGAAGDQAPYLTAVRTWPDENGVPRRTQTHDDGHILADLLGERLGDTALRTAAQIRTAPLATPLRVIHAHVEVPAQKPPAGLRTLRPTTSYTYEPDGSAQVPIVAVHLGVTALAGLQAELNAATGMGVKAASPFPHTCLVTMVNGAAKYMADAGSYDRITYEAMNSRYARGAAETVTGRLDGLLRELHTTDPQRP